ncbi:aldo/keto reductase [Curtobacterium ammoniigenes]|uniref:aldo/keto reductase n=1 Tax=Curtobacterium ammoniigenes TaxID=395387 RepID=UPI00082DB895|nr:aldo/keto reductase [Curtobacterium ammoniigenes]
MRHVKLGTLDVSRIGLGCMGMSAFYSGINEDDDASTATIHRAVELGVTFFDTAEMYGPYTNERLVGAALRDHRDDVVIATKGGTYRHIGPNAGERGIDGSAANIRAAVEGSLERLGTDRIDLYYQHRPDPNTPIEETAGVFKKLIEEGKILHYGLSEAAPDRIRAAHAVHPVTAVQTEYSLWTRDPEEAVLPAVRELGIGFVPYSPLGRGFLTGKYRDPAQFDSEDFRRANPRFSDENFRANLAIVDEVERIAKEADATPAQVAIAWVLSKGDDLAPIPGTKRIERLEENLAADSLVLTADQLAALDALQPAAGDRYPDMSSVNI